jgi:hypothetical protein
MDTASSVSSTAHEYSKVLHSTTNHAHDSVNRETEKAMLKRMTMAASIMLLFGAFTLPVWSCECDPVMEVEPNGFDPTGQTVQDQTLGVLAAGDCVAITGSIATGFGDPNNPNPTLDYDFYSFGLEGASQFTLKVVEPVVLMAWDYNTGQPLEGAQCQEQDTAVVCVVPAPTNLVLLRVVAQEALPSYTVQITAGAGTGEDPLPPSVGTTAMDATATYDALAESVSLHQR